MPSSMLRLLNWHSRGLCPRLTHGRTQTGCGSSRAELWANVRRKAHSRCVENQAVMGNCLHERPYASAVYGESQRGEVEGTWNYASNLSRRHVAGPGQCSASHRRSSPRGADEVARFSSKPTHLQTEDAMANEATQNSELSPKAIRNIVLVHGAFTDGSCWAKIIPPLQQKGYHVVAVQNPMTSLADEVSATKRILALQDGPVLLVGHSWGGVVITEAGDGPKVAGLVYLTAYAPEVGQSANDAGAPYGWTEGQKQIRVDSDQFAYVTPE